LKDQIEGTPTSFEGRVRKMLGGKAGCEKSSADFEQKIDRMALAVRVTKSNRRNDTTDVQTQKLKLRGFFLLGE
jgi:hypothetical protein